jgi:hypothetical protein
VLHNNLRLERIIEDCSVASSPACDPGNFVGRNFVGRWVEPTKTRLGNARSYDAEIAHFHRNYLAGDWPKPKPKISKLYDALDKDAEVTWSSTSTRLFQQAQTTFLRLEKSTSSQPTVRRNEEESLLARLCGCLGSKSNWNGWLGGPIRWLTNTVIHICKTYFQDELCAKRRDAETERLSAVITSRVAANTESSSSW